jgi:hypothetical protein
LCVVFDFPRSGFGLIVDIKVYSLHIYTWPAV